MSSAGHSLVVFPDLCAVNKIKLSILASGSGTNAENIARYFKNHEEIEVAKILTNKRDAYVLERARKLGIPSAVFSRAEFKEGSFLQQMEASDYLILAGFLWLIPDSLIVSFQDRIINIHPALLPKFGGKGMYGSRVHQSVIESGESQSGITIHLVNEEYDKGRHLFQAKCDVLEKDTAESLAKKIHELEYAHFPRVIEEYILS